MIPCPNKNCERDNVDTAISYIGCNLANVHLFDFNPMKPKQQFCGRDPVNLSDWGNCNGTEAGTARLVCIPNCRFMFDYLRTFSHFIVKSGGSMHLQVYKS